MSSLGFSPGLGRTIRQDPPRHLGDPTRPLLEAAVRAGRVTEAVQWLDYFLRELANIRDIFGVWDWYMVRYFLDRTGLDAWPRLVRESIAPWIGTTAGVKGAPAADVAIEGQNAGLTVPGAAWTFHLTERDRQYNLSLDTPSAQDGRWAKWRTAVEGAIHGRDTVAVGRLLDTYVEEARLIHDVMCDWAWALITVVARTWGEAVLGEVLRVTEEPWVTVRYAKIAALSVEDSLRLTVEGMRGHFSGPDRRGEISVVEEADRYVLSFDACGTGGRMRRGDVAAGTGSRLAPPYNFLNVAGAYNWTWNRKGVCAYCAHCAVVNQILPIEKLGRPMRMTLYPDDPDDPCRWVIYKDPNAFPGDAFAQVGLKKSSAQGAPVNWHSWIEQHVPATEIQRGGAAVWPKGGHGLIGDRLGPVLHLHDGASEIFYIVAGRCRLEIGNSDAFLGPGDFVLVPPEVPHNLWNAGEEDLLVFWIVAPNLVNNKWRTTDFPPEAMDRRARRSRVEDGIDLPSDANIRTRLLTLREPSVHSAHTAASQEVVVYLTEGQAKVTVGGLGGELQANEFAHVPLGTAYSVAPTGGPATLLLFEMPCG